jgi:hypothetical protein
MSAASLPEVFLIGVAISKVRLEALFADFSKDGSLWFSFLISSDRNAFRGFLELALSYGFWEGLIFRDYSAFPLVFH